MRAMEAATVPQTAGFRSPPPSHFCDRSARLHQHRALVRRAAGRIKPRLPKSVQIEDLMQAGLIGLNDAMSRFDERRGASFETYASRRIEGAMLDELRAIDPLTRDARSRQREIRDAVHQLEHQLGRAPRAREVANALAWTLEEFHEAMANAGDGEVRADDDDFETFDHIGSIETLAHSTPNEHADPLQTLQQRQRHEALVQACELLEGRDRYIMEMFYERDVEMKEIAATLGISGARVSQLHEAIIAKLRLRLRQW